MQFNDSGSQKKKRKQRKKIRKKILAVRQACEAIFGPNPGYEMKTIDLPEGEVYFCVRGIPAKIAFLFTPQIL